MDEADFLRLAEALATVDRPETLRSAVSRAYYAVFHMTRRLQDDLGGRKVHSHEILADRFQTSDHPALKDIGVRIARLKQDRHRADYVLSGRARQNVELPASVGPIIRGARALFEDVKHLAEEPLRSVARRAVLDDDVRRFSRSRG